MEQPTRYIELDVAHTDGETPREAAQALAGTAEVVRLAEFGPGGGWPLYRFSGTAGQLLDVLIRYCEGDELEALDRLNAAGILVG